MLIVNYLLKVPVSTNLTRTPEASTPTTSRSITSTLTTYASTNINLNITVTDENFALIFPQVEFKVNKKINYYLRFDVQKQRNYQFLINNSHDHEKIANVTTKPPPYYIGIDVPKVLYEPIITDRDTSAHSERYNFYLCNLEFKYDAVLKGFESIFKI